MASSCTFHLASCFLLHIFRACFEEGTNFIYAPNRLCLYYLLLPTLVSSRSSLSRTFCLTDVTDMFRNRQPHIRKCTPPPKTGPQKKVFSDSSSQRRAQEIPFLLHSFLALFFSFFSDTSKSQMPIDRSLPPTPFSPAAATFFISRMGKKKEYLSHFGSIEKRRRERRNLLHWSF